MSITSEVNTLLGRMERASPVGKMVRYLLEPLLRGQTTYPVAWDDMRAPATGINPPGAASDPAVAEDGTFQFSGSTENLIAVILQMPHSWRVGTELRPHVHWGKTTNATGDVQWEMRYRVISEGAVPPAWSEWLPANSRSQEPGSTMMQVIDGFPAIDMTGQKISAIVSFQIRRYPAATKDTYNAPVTMWEFDAHYQLDGFGSSEEYVKSGA